MTEPDYIFGYPSRFSVRAGEALFFHVSTSASSFDLDIVRIFNTDPNPRAGGMRLIPVPGSEQRAITGRRHATVCGSHILADQTFDLSGFEAISFSVRVFPTTLDDTLRALVELAGRGHCISIGMTQAAVVVAIAGPHGSAQISLPTTFERRRWTEIELMLDFKCGTAALSRSIENTLQALPHQIPLTFDRATIAAAADMASFNGKLEEPTLRGCCDGIWQDLARWDFSQEIPTDLAIDISGNARHGRMINAPLRAVTGSRWTGEEMCWRHKPEHYAAVWFHDDDLGDCGWPETITVSIPPDWPSGVYGARLRSSAGEEIVPFVVRSKVELAWPCKRARIAFLMPTFTYMAYANMAFGHSLKPEYRERQVEWGAYPHHADAHPAFGRSLYDRHSDGSGIAISTRLRPILNFRPGALHIFDAPGSGIRHFVADTHLIDWLERKGFDCEIVTDEDLDDEGIAALQGCDILLTGTHPEYHTSGTLDALQAFRCGGGKIAYLGGNGFYWRVARSTARPHLIELRRAEGGVRAWETAPGESYHATDGTYGGLWRRNGRPPQDLVGVGFSALGGYEAKPYKRCAASYDPRFAWLFDGIEHETLGNFGLVCGAAAGYEIDRFDPTPGSSDDIALLATSAGQHYETFAPALEDILAPGLTTAYGNPADLIRSDMIYQEDASGSAIFAVGSVTFCGSLPHEGYDNDISRLLGNLLSGWLSRPPRPS